MAFIVPLEKATRADGTVGEKAGRLGELLKEKLPVPEGFVLTTEAFQEFSVRNRLEERIGQEIAGLNADDYDSLVNVSGKIREFFMKGEFTDELKKQITENYDQLMVSDAAKNLGGVALDFIKAGRDQTDVAVRPSPADTGHMEAVLNVAGVFNVLEGIRFSWASAYSPRAIYYRKRKGLPVIASSALVVQRMINSDKSGSMVQLNSDILVEGTWGWGIALSSGMVSPDRYYLDRDSGSLKEKAIGKKHLLYAKDGLTGRTSRMMVMREKVESQLLEERELKKLHELHSMVSQVSVQSQVMEWAIWKNRVYLLQSKPFTRKTKEETKEGKVFLKGFGVSLGSGKGSVRLVANSGDFKSINAGDMIVTKTLSPDLMPFLGKAAGIISENGGLASTLAEACREWEVPCVAAVDISGFEPDQPILISGSTGEISRDIILESGVQQYQPQQKQEGYSSLKETGHGFEIVSTDAITATEVRVNLDFRQNPIDGEGVGLLKSDGLFDSHNPVYLAKANPDELTGMLMRMGLFAKQARPYTVWYRSYGMSSVQPDGFLEPNPLLGWRGVRRSIEDPDVLKCEVEAINRLRSHGLDNIGIVLPFVTNHGELRSLRHMIPYGIRTAIEISTPAACMNIEPFLAEGISMVIVNLPELAQLTLGVDRGNRKVSGLYSEADPAITKMVSHMIKACRQANVEVSVHFQGFDPYVAEGLIRSGVSSISVDRQFLEMAKGTVSRVEKRMLLENIRDRAY